jgi:hypothetical protein
VGVATGKSTQLTKQIGEYLVCAELCRRGLLSTTFTGNVPDYDIVAINSENDSRLIQVKTIRAGDWQLNAKNFLIIDISDEGVQTIKGRKYEELEPIIFVFVKLDSQGDDEFYIVDAPALVDMIYENHNGFLKKHKGIRPRNPKSTHTAVSRKGLSKYRDNWGVITD